MTSINASCTYQLQDGIALLNMNDGKANALSDAMITSLSDALDRAHEEASAIVLSGRPDRFCAGFDLRVMMSSPDAARALLARGASLFMRFYGSKIPLVVACTGHALAGGALLVLTGDMRIGAEGDYRIGLNEVAIGMPVPVLATELVRDRLLETEHTRATLLSHIYGPQQAVAAGYLDRIVPADQVIATAVDEAKRLGALPQQAFEASKLRLRRASIEHISSTLEEDMRTLLQGR